MNGWIQFDGSRVPFVSFDVSPVGLWGQRRTPDPGSLVRKAGDHWVEVGGPAGELGVYVGHGYVLTVSAKEA
jgi:hypothetical protein